MKTTLLVLLACLLLAGPAFAQGGLISVKSTHDVATTVSRLENALQEKGVTVFARIDHAQGAMRVGQGLPPTVLMIFGNPALGTPLIQRSRSIGIDLPLKALIWEDRDGQVWFTYNDPDQLVRRHGITEMGDIVANIEAALSGLAAAAAQP